MANNFWANSNLEPKRTNRWIVYMRDPFYSWIAKKVTRPAYDMEAVSHQWLNHKFNFPGRITWKDISIDIVDVGSTGNQVGGTLALYEMLLSAGYVYPTDENQTSSISKQGAINALGQIKIHELDVNGNPLEEFTLYNSFATTVNLGDLSYDSEDIVTLSLTIKYDYAEYRLL